MRDETYREKIITQVIDKFKTRLPIGTLIVSVEPYVYGDSPPRNSNGEHSVGIGGGRGEYCLILDHFSIRNGSDREFGVKAWHLKSGQVIWIWHRPMKFFTKMVDNIAGDANI